MLGAHLHHPTLDGARLGVVEHNAALELLVGQATAPSTTLTGLTMNAGNSLTVRSAGEGSRVRLLQAWTDVQAAGVFRVKSPRMHDNVQGIRYTTVASDLAQLLPDGGPELLYPQDVLTAELSGSATAGDIETAAMLLYYDDLPGASARLETFDAILPRIVHTVTIENTLSLGTAGGYSGEEALNAEFSLLRANTDYALLGYVCSAECAAVRWRGVDTGNLGVGGPGDDSRRQDTRSWFVNLSRAFGAPCIPILNSANVAGVLIDGVQDENGTDVTVNTILAELS